MRDFVFTYPTKVYFGEGAASQALEAEAGRIGNTVMLAYGGGAAELAMDCCESCGIHPSYINVLMMVDNWLPSFDMNEQKCIDKKVEEHLQVIKEEIDRRTERISPVTDADRAAHQQFLAGQAALPENAWQYMIQIKEGCIGCGICQKVCPSGSIRMENSKAVHIPGNCQSCLACVHHCPQKAIVLSIPEKNPDARYRNEHISLQEIMEANGQGA